MMAEFDDIEYEGIGGEGHITVRSDRCFRDYSPEETVISLSDDGKALFSSPVPAFANPPPGHPELDSAAQQPQSESHHGDPAGRENHVVPPALSHDALVAMQQRAPLSARHQLSPLTRYRHDAQGHEQIALGIKSEDLTRHSDLGSLSPQPPKANGNVRSSQHSAVSSLRLSPASSHRMSLIPISPDSPEASSAADQLRELEDAMKTPDWDDDMSSEQKIDYLRRAARLSRWIRSQAKPREARPPKVRKRDSHPRGSKDHRSSSS